MNYWDVLMMDEAKKSKSSKKKTTKMKKTTKYPKTGRTFRTGAPQVTFRKLNGNKFTMTYHTRTAAAKSVKAWRSVGGTVIGTGSYKLEAWKSKSGLTSKTLYSDRNKKGRAITIW